MLLIQGGPLSPNVKAPFISNGMTMILKKLLVEKIISSSKTQSRKVHSRLKHSTHYFFVMAVMSNTCFVVWRIENLEI